MAFDSNIDLEFGLEENKSGDKKSEENVKSKDRKRSGKVKETEESKASSQRRYF